MKVRLDAEKCTGHGRCYELAPELFAEDERGHCRLRTAEVPKALEDDARLGEANCPENAITVED
jgi:ferredoxin